MSEASGGGAQAPGRATIRSPKDFWGGLALIGLAAFAIWAGSDLPGMSGFKFGPGTAPRLFAYLLMALGFAIVMVGLLSDGPPAERYTFSGTFSAAALVVALIPVYMLSARLGHFFPGVHQDVVVAAVGTVVVIGLALALMNVAPRGPVFITAATLVFAVAVRPLGLVIASFVSLVASSAATTESRWIETIIWAAILTAFCCVLFPYGLNLPLQLWPRF
jgi:putative tricarboxylic transport membrane protein